MKKQRPEPFLNLKVHKETHSRIKQYCNDNDYYLQSFVTDILNRALDNLDTPEVKQKRIMYLLEQREKRKIEFETKMPDDKEPTNALKGYFDSKSKFTK
jgi:hypothetical protein